MTVSGKFKEAKHFTPEIQQAPVMPLKKSLLQLGKFSSFEEIQSRIQNLSLDSQMGTMGWSLSIAKQMDLEALLLSQSGILIPEKSGRFPNQIKIKNKPYLLTIRIMKPDRIWIASSLRFLDKLKSCLVPQIGIWKNRKQEELASGKKLQRLFLGLSLGNGTKKAILRKPCWTWIRKGVRLQWSGVKLSIKYAVDIHQKSSGKKMLLPKCEIEKSNSDAKHASSPMKGWALWNGKMVVEKTAHLRVMYAKLYWARMVRIRFFRSGQWR